MKPTARMLWSLEEGQPRCCSVRDARGWWPTTPRGARGAGVDRRPRRGWVAPAPSGALAALLAAALVVGGVWYVNGDGPDGRTQGVTASDEQPVEATDSTASATPSENTTFADVYTQVG